MVGELLQDLRSFELETAFCTLSHLNYVLSRDDPGSYWQAVSTFFAPEVLRRIEALARREQAPVLPLYRQQILTAMKLLLLSHAESGGRRRDDPAARKDLGLILLKVADLCAPTCDGSVSILGKKRVWFAADPARLPPGLYGGLTDWIVDTDLESSLGGYQSR